MDALTLELIEAAKAGDVDRVRELVAAGAEPDRVSIDFAATVELALENGDAKRLRNLAKLICDPPHPHHARAREVAESLGRCELTSRSVDEQQDSLAWGLYVVRDVGDPLAIGVSIVRPTLVIMDASADHELAFAVLAKTVARVAKELTLGAVVQPNPHDYDPGVDVSVFSARWQLETPTSNVEDAVAAVPVEGRTIAAQQQLELLGRCAVRAKQLLELDAPPSIIENDRTMIRRAWERLGSMGWSRERDPLPEDVWATVGPLVRSRSSQP